MEKEKYDNVEGRGSPRVSECTEKKKTKKKQTHKLLVLRITLPATLRFLSPGSV